MLPVKGTSISEAIKRFESRTGQDATKVTYVGLQFQWPPIRKMDKTLATLENCTKLSLSTNMIEKIEGLKELKNLKILSLARNYIKNLAGIESLGETLEQLWISYNLIEKLGPLESMKVLKVLYMAHNMVKDWGQFAKLTSLPQLEDLVFVGNPVVMNMETTVYRKEIMRRLPNLRKLDAEPCIAEGQEENA